MTDEPVYKEGQHVERLLGEIKEHREDFAQFVENEWHPHKREQRRSMGQVEQIHTTLVSLPAVLAPYATLPTDLKEIKTGLLQAATSDRKPSNGVPASVVLIIILALAIVFAVPQLIEKLSHTNGDLDITKEGLRIKTNQIQIVPAEPKPDPLATP